MRDNWLSNRALTSYENIVDHCANAWNELAAALAHRTKITSTPCTVSGRCCTPGCDRTGKLA